MELTLVNPYSYDLAENFGISKGRQLEISAFLDAMAKENYPSKEYQRTVFMGIIYKEIAKACNTLEELIYAILLHDQWLYRQRQRSINPSALHEINRPITLDDRTI